MRVCLFEDNRTSQLEPLTLTRPVFTLLCGAGCLADKQYGYFRASQRGAWVRPILADLCRVQDGRAAFNDRHWLGQGPVVLVNGRWLPPAPSELGPPAQAGVGLVGDEAAYVILPEPPPPGSLDCIDDALDGWCRTLPCRPAGGRLFSYLWELVEHNGAQLLLDWEGAGRPCSAATAGLGLVGPADRLFVHPTARVDPMVVVDTTRGPVVVDREAVVTAFSRLEGPCYVGPGSHLLGARLRGGTTLGPCCRIGGEVECSIIQGYSNKCHDGFLGHAYLGEWVNLGAGTQNSDLRNDYEPVNVIVDGRKVATGLTKVGCFVGDHTKTGLSTLLNTGTNVGIFCNLLPSGGYLPRHIPSFASWWKGELVDRADLAQLVHTSQLAMGRRGVTLTDAHVELYHALFEQTAGSRRDAVALTSARQTRLGTAA